MTIVQLNAHENMTVEEVLTFCLRKAQDGEFHDVMIIGHNADGTMFSYSSSMTRANANWILDKSKIYALNLDNGIRS